MHSGMKQQIFSLLLLLGIAFSAQTQAPWPLAWDKQVPVAYTASEMGAVRLHPDGAPLAGPYYELGGAADLVLHFDDLEGGYPNYTYTLRHCDRFWYPSDFDIRDYLSGWGDATVDEVNASFGPIDSYTHCHARIPTDDLAPIVSGNYLLIVHRSGTPDDIVLMRRMVVFEKSGGVTVELQRAIRADQVLTHQRIRVTAELPTTVRLTNPMGDVALSVIQNGCWDGAAVAVAPAFLRGDVLTFEQDPALSFSGSDHWRSADLKSTRYRALGVSRLSRSADGWSFEMTQAKSRRFKMQSGRPDLNGEFVVHNDEFDEVETSSEYVDVHFSLAHQQFGTAGPEDVYIYGALSAWTFPETHRMVYSPDEQMYRLTLRLKQGYYDYLFLTPNAPTLYTFEGEHASVQNRYATFIYAPNPRGLDRVIGMERLE
jgi:hypothetical protein